MKVIAKAGLETSNPEKVIDTLKVFQKVVNPFSVTVHHIFSTREKIYVIMELIEGVKLRSYIKKKFQMKEKEVKFFSAEILCAIKLFHQDCALHLNLNPNVIMIDAEGHVKVNL